MYGQGSGPVLLNNVQCRASEYRLFDCPREQLEINSCRLHEDAGIECLTGELTLS